MTSGPTKAKRHVRYFLSYAHADNTFSTKLLSELDKHLSACRDFTFERWQDAHILAGEKWHGEIQKALEECDFGLLLVSPAFLGSQYIGRHELPTFLNGVKPFIPVGLCRIDFDSHDTKTLAESQIFLHAGATGRGRKYFSECKGGVFSDFAHSLFGNIVSRLGKISNLGASVAASVPVPAHTSLTSELSNNLPRLPFFFGREAELNIIAKELLPHSRKWGVLIDGPGGIGKTSLAVRAAEMVANQFNRVLFISTKGQRLTTEGVVNVSDPIVPAYLNMLKKIAGLLALSNVEEKAETDRLALIRRSLGQQKVLLILDNLESLSKDQSAKIFEFLSDLPPSCKAVITSRRRTDVDARIIRLERLGQDAALAFMEELSLSREQLARAPATDRLHLYHETGGNPLLLRWVVGQLGRGSCRSVAQALELCRNASEANDPLEFIFGDLLESFTEAETKVLAALACLNGQVEARFVKELAGLTKAATHTALADLANRYLVVSDESEKTFVPVPMVADFLRRKRPHVMQEISTRHEKRAYSLIVENGGNNHEQFPFLDAAWPMLAAALPLFLAGENARLQTVCSLLRKFLDFSGRWDERLALNDKAETRAKAEKDFINAGWRANHAGMVHNLRKEADLLLACAERATAYWQAEEVGESERAADCRLRGLAYKLKGDFASAITAHLKAVELWQGQGSASMELCSGLNALANAEADFGDHVSAEKHYQEALQVADAISYVEGMAGIKGNMAELALLRKDWYGAEILAREALLFAETIHRKELIASCSQILAQTLIPRGRAQEAMVHAKAAVEIFARIKAPDLPEAEAVLAECEDALFSD